MPQINLSGGDGITGQTGEEFREALNTMLTELYAMLHTRKHALNDEDDHQQMGAEDYRKLVAISGLNGKPILRFLDDSDIPNTIARVSALLAHTSNYNNPHNVTAEQLGLGTVAEPINYLAGTGLSREDIDEFNKVFNLEPSTLPAITSMANSDVFVVGFGAGADPKKITLANVKTLMGVNAFHRGQVFGVDDTYHGVEVLATGPGITTAITGGNTVTLTIPSGIRLISVKMIIMGYSTVTFKMGTTDMVNNSIDTRWLPIFQAWNLATSNQLTGATLTVDPANFDTFTVNGLNNTGVKNLIRLSF